MSIHQRTFNAISAIMAERGPTESAMNDIFEFLLHYRCLLINNTLIQHDGVRVFGGPFAGMILPDPVNRLQAPLLLGCYEGELHDIVQAIPNAGYQRLINIGCGEGYYAVGIKRLAPQIEVWAHDIDPEAQRKCQQAAALNGVDIHVGGVFDPQHFALHAGHRTLVWCDIEGAEAVLLDPVLYPALAHMDILVEMHPTDGGHTRDSLPARFADTHDIDIRHPGGHAFEMPDWLRDGSQLNQLLARLEWRGCATPWAMMRARAA
ncbi:methyltransferase [Niveispirillum sp.]|uniref:methyltransferase n=1 Tax=Niveispirillum sp. TaxID=1917217 RepID=UPI001B665A96|nr:methyltransferase [Niveispirillum sp.]MBP7338229.1 methyltransferase [Niveispirillum sp.]